MKNYSNIFFCNDEIIITCFKGQIYKNKTERKKKIFKNISIYFAIKKVDLK